MRPICFLKLRPFQLGIAFSKYFYSSATTSAETVSEPLLSKTTTINEQYNTILSKYNLNLAKFNQSTQTRLKLININDLNKIIESLQTYGIESNRIVETLQNYDDWSVLTDENLNIKFQFFSQLKLKPPTKIYLISRNKEIFNINDETLKHNLNQLKNYFTSAQLESILTKSPTLLTINDFYAFQYKFSYLYCIMGINQKQMHTTFVFNHSIDHIRQRHLFLSRAGLYDKPNKKHETKVKNPLLADIVDTTDEKYLKNACKDLFTIDDYNTFCDYLKYEDFEDELLGYNTDNVIKETVLKELKKRN